MATTARVWPTVCCDLLAHIFLSNPGSGIRVNVETFTVRQCIRHLYLPKDLSRVNKSTFWGQSSSGLLALSRFLQTLCITSPQHPAAISCCPTSPMMHTFASFVKYPIQDASVVWPFSPPTWLQAQWLDFEDFCSLSSTLPSLSYNYSSAFIAVVSSFFST